MRNESGRRKTRKSKIEKGVRVTEKKFFQTSGTEGEAGKKKTRGGGEKAPAT